MKKLLFTVILAIVLLQNTFAFNYDIDWTFNANMPFKAKSYSCSTSICNENAITLLQTKTSSGNSLKLDLTGSATMSSRDNYAIFLYPDNQCYLPTGMQHNLPSWGYYYPDTITWSTNYNFNKQDADHCGSNVASPVLKANNVPLTCTKVNDNRYDCGTVNAGTILSMQADLQSAWNLTGFANTADYRGITFIPDALNAYYDSTINVKFKVNGNVNQSEQFNTPWYPQWTTKSYIYRADEPGTYILRIETNMEDECKCSERPDGTRSNVKYKEVVVRVPQPYCGDSICNDENGKTCEPNGASKDDICTGNADTGDLANGVCRISGPNECTYCGDGYLQTPEETCDYNADTENPDYEPDCRDSGQYKCTFCGDGIKQPSEECDDENTNNNDACRNDCTLPYCGDGILDSGEECDDGNSDNNDGCSAICAIEYGCLDGYKKDNVNIGLPGWTISLQRPGSAAIISTEITDGTGHYRFSGLETGYYNVSEVMQPGWELNPGSYIEYKVYVPAGSACARQNFINKQSSYCGDSNLDPGEECDDGNTANGDGCSSACEFEGCVEGIKRNDTHTGLPGWEIHAKQAGQPDSESIFTITGADGLFSFNGLRPGMYEFYEIMQPGWEPVTLARFQAEVLPSDVCINIAFKNRLIPRCGDNICNQISETCEPDGTVKDDMCLNNADVGDITNGICRTTGTEACTYCGDGIKQPSEECDDENTNNNDACRNDCTLPYCGDGILDSGEECDDGNSDNGDECDNLCFTKKECILEIEKADAPDPAYQGDQLNYSIVVRNIGDADCTEGGVRVKEYYPASLLFLDSVPGPLHDDDFWNFGTLKPGEEREITILTVVQEDAVCPQTIVNTACAYSAELAGWVCVDEPTDIICRPCTDDCIIDDAICIGDYISYCGYFDEDECTEYGYQEDCGTDSCISYTVLDPFTLEHVEDPEGCRMEEYPYCALDSAAWDFCLDDTILEQATCVGEDHSFLEYDCSQLDGCTAFSYQVCVNCQLDDGSCFSMNCTRIGMTYYEYGCTGGKCEVASQAEMIDIDNDIIDDRCDTCIDADHDKTCDDTDNCKGVYNPSQVDTDRNGRGDACSDDKDGDGYPGTVDCNDWNARINPGAAEIKNNGIDDDCNADTKDKGTYTAREALHVGLLYDETQIKPGGMFDVVVSVTNNDRITLKDVQVIASIPGMQAKQAKLLQSLRSGETGRKVFSIEMPEDLSRYEYLRVAVSDNTYKRTIYREIRLK